MEKTFAELEAERAEAIKAGFQILADYAAEMWKPLNTFYAEHFPIPSAPYINKVRSGVKSKGGDRVKRLLPRDSE